MSDASGSRRQLSAVLPGLPQLLAGRWGAGGTALLVWLGLLIVLVTRFGRVAAGVGGAWDERLAVGTLVVGLAAAWTWSWRDVGRSGEPKRVGVSQWDLAVRAFSKNRTAVAGLMAIVALYLVALLTPLLAPLDPTFQGDLLTEFPEEERIWHEAEPVYEERSGWQTSTQGLREYGELPTKAREYLERLSELIGVGFGVVSTGPERDETILMSDSPLTRWYPGLRGSIPPR